MAGSLITLSTIWGGMPPIAAAQENNYKSLIPNGEFEEWADPAGIADDWTWTENQAADTKARTAGSWTIFEPQGSYYQSIQYTSPSAAALGELSQEFVLPGGVNGYSAAGGYDIGLGYSGRTFYAYAHVREANNTGTAKCQVHLDEYDEDDSLIGTTSSSDTVLTSSWQSLVTSSGRTLSASARKLAIRLDFESTGTSAIDLQIDDATLQMYYIVARNPTMPDRQLLMTPHRKLMRTAGGVLIRGRRAIKSKHEKVLNFGMMGIDQVKELRAFYTLDYPVRIVMDHPHLPEYLDWRIDSFEYNLLRGASFSSDMYSGVMRLLEL